MSKENTAGGSTHCQAMRTCLTAQILCNEAAASLARTRAICGEKKLAQNRFWMWRENPMQSRICFFSPTPNKKEAQMCVPALHIFSFLMSCFFMYCPVYVVSVGVWMVWNCMSVVLWFCSSCPCWPVVCLMDACYPVIWSTLTGHLLQNQNRSGIVLLYRSLDSSRLFRLFHCYV